MKPDHRKACLGSCLLFATIPLALIAVIIGSLARDLRTGGILGLITFAVFFLLTGAAFLSIDDPGQYIASLPILAGMAYQVLPDIPGPVDDVTVQLGGAVLSYLLWVKRDANFPRWGIVVLVAAALYPILGTVIPGPVDEIAANLIAIGSVVLGSRRSLPESSELSPFSEVKN